MWRWSTRPTSCRPSADFLPNWSWKAASCPLMPWVARRTSHRRSPTGASGTCWPSRTTSPTYTPTCGVTSPTWTAPATIMGDANGIRDKLDPDHHWAWLCCALLHHQPARDHQGLPRDRLGARPLGHREPPALSAGRHFPGGLLHLCNGLCCLQHGGPAADGLELPDPPQALLGPKMSIHRLRTMIEREPIMARWRLCQRPRL